ncbi:hypothetical protein WA026_008469 [Henosepilachna vigintioctopunctata]|uniref:Dynein assembly factor 3, axonemal n=1 Tax=Henosepilachna vigintioctopunctata TaxID=420089 RepID=A0AAW1UKN2_9CUCU
MFWGLTPALDFQSECGKDEFRELNILLIGGSDCRHILKTIARRYRYHKVNLNFFVMESCMEVVARELLFLLLAFMPQKELGEVQKTRIFMELYGNTIVRPYVARFLTSSSKELLRMVTDYDYLNLILPFVELDIKYKERDYLENILKFWGCADKFDISDSWDRRMRKMLGIRYDAKSGVFDWDLHMRFHSIGGAQVGAQEYKSFRTNGVSFVWLESEGSKSNRSLVCVTVPNGESYIHYGYLGDMQTGPFVSYGLDCEDETFLKSENNQKKFRATDVTERNLRQIFHEIEFGEKYEHATINDYLMGTLRMQEENRVIDVCSDNMLSRTKSYKAIDVEGLRIKFISISQFKHLIHKEGYKSFFNIIYFGSCYLQYLEKDVINHIAANNSLLLIENQRYVLNHRDKNLMDFADNIKQKMEGINATEMGFDPVKHDYARYILKV